MFHRNLMPLAACLLLTAGLAVAGTSENGKPASKPDRLTPGKADISRTIDDLSNHVELWHEAALEGDDGKCHQLEGQIREIVGRDLAETQQVVRYYAKRAALDKSVSSKSPDNNALSAPDSAGEKRAFRRSLSLLNSKERVSRSFVRVKAFSHKYRLINDYVDLLRKQLDMPKLELADRPSGPEIHPVKRSDK